MGATPWRCLCNLAVRVDCDGPLRPINRPTAIATKGGTHTDSTSDPGNTETPDGGR